MASPVNEAGSSNVKASTYINMKRMDDKKNKKAALCQQKHEKNQVLCHYEQMHMKYEVS